MNYVSLLLVGLAIAGLPLLCLVILVVSTGHAIKGGLESVFFGLVYVGYYSFRIAVPLGLILAIIAIIQMLRLA